MRYVQRLASKSGTEIRVRARLDGHYVRPSVDLTLSRSAGQCWAVLTEDEAVELRDMLTRALETARRADVKQKRS